MSIEKPKGEFEQAAARIFAYVRYQVNIGNNWEIVKVDKEEDDDLGDGEDFDSPESSSPGASGMLDGIDGTEFSDSGGVSLLQDDGGDNWCVTWKLRLPEGVESLSEIMGIEKSSYMEGALDAFFGRLLGLSYDDYHSDFYFYHDEDETFMSLKVSTDKDPALFPHYDFDSLIPIADEVMDFMREWKPMTVSKVFEEYGISPEGINDKDVVYVHATDVKKLSDCDKNVLPFCIKNEAEWRRIQLEFDSLFDCSAKAPMQKIEIQGFGPVEDYGKDLQVVRVMERYMMKSQLVELMGMNIPARHLPPEPPKIG